MRRRDCRGGELGGRIGAATRRAPNGRSNMSYIESHIPHFSDQILLVSKTQLPRWVPGKRKHTQRTHKKTHGLISFHDIARTTSDSWKVVDDDTHKFVTELARLIAVRYKEIEEALGGPLPDNFFGGRKESTASSTSTRDDLNQFYGQLLGLNSASDHGHSSLNSSSSHSGWWNGPVTTSGNLGQLQLGFWEGTGDAAVPESNHHHQQGIVGVASQAGGISRRASVGHSAGAAVAERQAQQQQQQQQQQNHHHQQQQQRMLYGSTLPSMSSTGMRKEPNDHIFHIEQMLPVRAEQEAESTFVPQEKSSTQAPECGERRECNPPPQCRLPSPSKEVGPLWLSRKPAMTTEWMDKWRAAQENELTPSSSAQTDLTAETFFWELRFRELEEYKRNHGDCRVPPKYSANPKLGNWVANVSSVQQTRTTKEFHEVKPTRLNLTCFSSTATNRAHESR